MIGSGILAFPGVFVSLWGWYNIVFWACLMFLGL